ncbi:hypothetical protein HK096_005493 [Nowakowskiella sp. JEL0078]|nr:hypothetical protein HK096_005493 [Nowakowskiella sp. JEL0078]
MYLAAIATAESRKPVTNTVLTNQSDVVSAWNLVSPQSPISSASPVSSDKPLSQTTTSTTIASPSTSITTTSNIATASLSSNHFMTLSTLPGSPAPHPNKRGAPSDTNIDVTPAKRTAFHERTNEHTNAAARAAALAAAQMYQLWHPMFMNSHNNDQQAGLPGTQLPSQPTSDSNVGGVTQTSMIISPNEKNPPVGAFFAAAGEALGYPLQYCTQAQADWMNQVALVAGEALSAVAHVDHDAEDGDEEQTPGSIKSYSCPTCPRSFSRLHENHRPFECNECGARFTRNHDLTRHQKIHTKEKPYICSFCGRQFARRDALKRHSRLDEYGRRIHCFPSSHVMNGINSDQNDPLGCSTLVSQKLNCSPLNHTTSLAISMDSFPRMNHVPSLVIPETSINNGV